MKKALTLLTLLLCAVMGAWADDSPTLSINESAQGSQTFLTTYATEGITISSSASFSSGAVQIGNTAGKYDEHYLEVLASNDAIEKVSFLISGNGSNKSIQAPVFGWEETATSSTADTYRILDAVTVTANSYAAAKWFEYDFSASDVKCVRIYRTTKNISSTDPAYTGSSTALGSGQTIKIYGIKVWLKASAPLTAPQITAQPVSADYTTGETATALTVAATASAGELSYQWYSCADAEKTGAAAISGEASTSFTPSTATAGTYYYFCRVTDNNGSTDSKVATIKVEDYVASAACILSKIVYSNSFDAFIVQPKAEVLYTAEDEEVVAGTKNVGDVKTPAANGTIKAYYLEGTTAPTITNESVTVSDKATFAIEGNTLTVTAEDGTTKAVFDITVEPVAPYTGGDITFDGTETWVKAPYGFSETDGKLGYKFAKSVEEDANRRISEGRNRIYFFVGASEKITIVSGCSTARNIKAYRNGEEVVASTSLGTNNATLDIPGDANAAYMIAVVSAQTGGDGSIKAINKSTGEEPTPSTFRNIKADLTSTALIPEGAAQWDDVSTGIAVAEDGTLSRVEKDAEDAVAVFNGKWHGTQYGWAGFTATVPVQGCVKITYGNSNYGSEVLVTNTEGTQVAKVNNKADNTWSADNADRVAVTYYRTNEPTTLNFSKCDYVGYFAVEAIDPADLPAEITTHKVTFAAGEGSGVVPAALDVNDGEKITLPKNTTLYAEGKTLTGWNDGTTTYNGEYTPTADVTLTAQYAQNAVAFADRTESVTAAFDFTTNNGATLVGFEGKTGFFVTQATVNGSAIDFKLDIDATSGKFNNSNGGWCQINPNTKLTLPACKGATFTLAAMSAEATATFAGNEKTGQNMEYTYDGDATTIDIIITGGTWFKALTAVYPVVEGGEEPVNQDKTGTWDYSDATVMSETMALSGSNEAGVVNAIEGNGLQMTVLANGASFRNNGNNIQVRQGAEFRIPVKYKNDVVTIKGYPGYSYYSINGGEEIKNTNDNPQTEYKATAADVAQGYVSIVSTNNNNYFYSIKVEQKAPSQDANIVEKSIYKTDFSEWEKASASSTPVVINKQTKYTNETLSFSLTGTSVMDTEDTKFSNYTALPRRTVRAEKNSNGTIITTALADITKVRFIHGATGGSRGWKLEAKGDGDAEWVVISDSYANPNAWCEVNATVNKKNCQLRFTNLADAQNAFLFELEIFGKVDLSGAPLLGSFKANNKTYVADEIFEMGSDNNYHADIELFKAEDMISEANPITEVTADNGEIGIITYAAGDDQCTATIPVTAEDKSVNYIINFIRKPFFTLTYVGPDGQEIGTQQAEKDAAIGTFQYNIADVAATKDGYKARGWFKQNYVGEKFTTESIITEAVNLYAVETEIEVSSTSRKYMFNLADKNFDAADHEAFSPQEGAQCKFHDTTHGWSAYNGDKIDLLVGPKAIISIALCRYGKGTNILVKQGENTLETLAGMDADTDGKVVSYTYEGEPGTITLEMVASGEMYIHSVKIANIAETNYEQQGDWYIVKAGDVSSFKDVLEIANGASGDNRVFVFVPNGEYDLGIDVQTPVSRDNVSIIGESLEGVIIKNAPPVSVEGLMSASTIHNTSNDLYMQDLTLQNDLDYYGAGAAGRANAFHDGGNRTIAKNVKLMSYQDTYLSGANKQFYWEGGEIHGAVDYMCGGGDAFFESVLLVNESRKQNEKNGEATMTAHQPQTAEKFGYVFNNCTVENKAASFNFGRAWGGASGATVRPTVTYLNTTLNQPTEIKSTRFLTAGMNNQSGVFHEYNSVDKDGNVVSPASNVQKFTDKNGGDVQEYETILTATEAANYTIDKVFTDWQPATIAAQIEAPNAEYTDGNVTWTAVNGATAYLLEKNGTFAGITTETSYAIEIDAENDKLTIRAANARGGFGEAKQVAGTATSLKAINAAIERGEQVIYNLSGQRVNNPAKGLYIINGRKVVIK